jgi:predicted benzoate:H+ symporter BenE
VALAAEAGVYTVESMLAAGLITAAFVCFLGVTGLIDDFNRLIPLPVVRGLQLGLGALLAKKGVALLDQSHFWPDRLLGWDGHLAACPRPPGAVKYP